MTTAPDKKVLGRSRGRGNNLGNARVFYCEDQS